nr:uncharacterized protein LOC127298258 [Lolium perenne]
MGATSYQRLSSPADTRRRGGAWTVLRRGLLRLCAARRQGRWVHARRGRCRRVSAGCGYGYDAEGYARNFDDGVWKAEEGVSWMTADVVGRCPVLL